MAVKKRKEVITVNETKWFLEVKTGKYTRWDYVWYKTQMLERWLLANNMLPKIALMPLHYGSVAGYWVMVDMVDKIEKHCKTFGIDCRAMVFEGLTGLEGLEVEVLWKSGKRSHGVVELRGKWIKYHTLIKGANKYGTVVKSWEVESVEVK